MGCVSSNLGGGEEEVVSICRDRKRFLKLALQRRSSLAQTHFRYCESLYAVSAAVRLFVARHSSPASPFLITFSPTQSSSTPPPASTSGDVACGDGGGTKTSAMLLRQRPSEPTKETVVPPPTSCGKVSSSSEDESECCCSLEGEEVEERDGEKAEGGGGGEVGFREDCRNGYFYVEMQAQAASPGRDFGWDFFNPFFGMGLEAMEGYRDDDDLHLRAVREEEGIPELEEEGVSEYAAAMVAKNVQNEKENAATVAEKGIHDEVVVNQGGSDVADSNGGNAGGGRQKGMTFVDDDPKKGRELLEALGDIEDHFVRAYNSGKEVSRMLEASKVHLMSDIQGIKG